MKLSIVIPVYNEESTIAAVLERVNTVPLPVDREVIVVNNGSRDGTASRIAAVRPAYPGLVSIEMERNSGKGAAIARRARGHRRRHRDSGCRPRSRSIGVRSTAAADHRRCADVVLGKKIKWQDGVVAVRVLFRYRVAPLERIVRGVEKGVPEVVS